MPLSPERVERINLTLRNLPPLFYGFRIDPAMEEKDLSCIAREVMEFLEESLYIMTACLETYDHNQIAPKALGKLLQVHECYFRLYRTLTEQRP